MQVKMLVKFKDLTNYLFKNTTSSRQKKIMLKMTFDNYH